MTIKERMLSLKTKVYNWFNDWFIEPFRRNVSRPLYENMLVPFYPPAVKQVEPEPQLVPSELPYIAAAVGVIAFGWGLYRSERLDALKEPAMAFVGGLRARFV